MFMTGPIATSLCERIGCRSVAIMGGVIGSLGTFLASFSTDIFIMYLTEGFLFGVGASLCYFPSVIILPQYFSKRLSLANGLVSCGSGVGTMVMGPVINILMNAYGWRICVRLSTVLMILVSVIALLFRPLVPPLNSQHGGFNRPLFDFFGVREQSFLYIHVCLISVHAIILRTVRTLGKFQYFCYNIHVTILRTVVVNC